MCLHYNMQEEKFSKPPTFEKCIHPKFDALNVPQPNLLESWNPKSPFVGAKSSDSIVWEQILPLLSMSGTSLEHSNIVTTTFECSSGFWA
jgi:hypothetical protein